MADINVLTQRRNSINRELAQLATKKSNLEKQYKSAFDEVNSLRKQAQRQLAGGDEAGAQFLFGLLDQAQAKQDTIGEQILQVDAERRGLEQELDQVNQQISQAQTGAQVSSGQVVKQAQTARDDGASAVNPPPPVKVLENGRVETAQDRAPTNAERPEPGEQDLGTDAATRGIGNTQSIPPITAAPGSPPTGRPGGAPANITATNQPGGGAAKEDNSGGTGVRARLNNLFGGVNNRIVPQENVLDTYASYTYNIAIYLMSADDYKKLLRSKKKTVAGFQLLMMSGGAGPAGSAAPSGQVVGSDPAVAAQERVAGLGRNEFFSLDYYIDDVQIKSLISGKATGGAHNVTELKFKVIEPNGITFLDNLFAATQQYIKVSGGDVNKNYAAQNFLMVIRFYGYDDQGNLVKASRSGQDAAGSDVNAIVEKFIPFQFTGIKFRIASRVVEYDCSAVCPQNNVNTSAARGVIPYNIELQSQTLKDLLTGTQQFAAATQGEGRATVAASTAAGVRTPTNSQGLGQIGDIVGA